MKYLFIDTGLANLGLWIVDKDKNIEFGIGIKTDSKLPLDVRINNIFDTLKPLIEYVDIVIFEHFQPRRSGITKVGATIEINGLISGMCLSNNKQYLRMYPHVWKPKRDKLLSANKTKDLPIKNSHIKDAYFMSKVFLYS